MTLHDLIFCTCTIQLNQITKQFSSGYCQLHSYDLGQSTINYMLKPSSKACLGYSLAAIISGSHTNYSILDHLQFDEEAVHVTLKLNLEIVTPEIDQT